MPAGLLQNLSSAFYFGFQRGFTVRPVQSLYYIESLVVKKSERLGACYHNRRSKHFLSKNFTQASLLSSQAFGKSSTAMAASSSTAAPGDLVMDALISSCGNVSICAKPSGVYFGNGGLGLSNCQRASISLRNGKAKSNSFNRAYCVLGVARKSSCSNALVGSWFGSGSTSASSCYSSKAVPDVSHDGSSSYDELLSSLAISPDQGSPADRALKLLSGSCYLPHPDKEKTGGEDAHFFCTDEQVVGVADGVGGWAEVGVNAGDYARELMSNSVNAIKDEPRESIDPARVLEKAHSETNARGSSTACIIVLKDQFLHAINLGDSGFIVVRDGRTIFESPAQQHSFNFTYQLERGNSGDLPSSGQVFQIPVSDGDVIVAGTDGLFDNLYNHEISSIVGMGTSAGFSPEATSKKITALARHRALDRKQQTPFSKAAQEAGFSYYGGKLDDITVVVSYIIGPNNK